MYKKNNLVNGSYTSSDGVSTLNYCFDDDISQARVVEHLGVRGKHVESACRKKSAVKHMHYHTVYAAVKKWAPAFLNELKKQSSLCTPFMARLLQGQSPPSEPHAKKRTLTLERRQRASLQSALQQECMEHHRMDY